MGSGKGGKVTVGYKYHLGMHLALCHGPIDAIKRIDFDGRTAWQAFGCDEFSGGSITVDAEELFGGDGREGGVSGSIDIEMGGVGQEPNDYLVAQLGDEVPGYRGIVGAVFRQFYFGNNPYLKSVSFRTSRIHVRQDGIGQWYDEKAAIQRLGGSIFDISSQSYVCEPPEDLSVDVSYGASTGYGGCLPADYDEACSFLTIEGVSADDIILVESRGYGWSAWLSDEDPLAEGLPWKIDFNVTTVDNGRTTYFNERFETVEEAQAGSLWDGIYLTGSTGYKFWISDFAPQDNRGDVRLKYTIIDRDQDFGKYCREILTPCCDDMNPAHIVRECLTDPDWGMGYPEADIDDDSFRHAADIFYSEKMGMSLLWSNEVPIEEFVYEILRHVDAVLYVDRSTGKFNLKPIRNDFAVSDLLVLDESVVLSVSDARYPAVDDLVSSVTVEFWDAVTGETGAVTEHNQALQQIQQGRGSSTTIQYPGFTTRKLAAQVARRDLIALSTPLLSCSIKTNRIPEGLYPGFAFILHWPALGIGPVVMRVQQMSLGDGLNNALTIEAVEDVFDLPGPFTVSESPQNGIWTDPADEPVLASLPRVAVEAPYYQLVVDYGEIDIGAILDSDSDAGFLLVAGGRQGAETNARISADNGAGYQDVGALDFVPYAYATSSIWYTDTVIYIDGGKDLDLVAAGSIAQIGDELVRVDAIDSDSNGQYVEVGRGVLDTVPMEHPLDSSGDGIAIVFWGYSPESDYVQYTASEQVTVKLRPVLGGSTLPLADAPEDLVVMDSRAIRPYPPGDLRIDAVSYPEPDSSGDTAPAFDGANTVSWTHRDRIFLTDGNLYDYTAGDIGPEAGTTYLVQAEGYDDLGSSTGIFVDKNVGLVDTYSFDSDDPEPGAGTLAVEIRVYSVRDSYLSRQPAKVLLSYSGGGNELWTPAAIATELWLDATDTATLWQDTAGTTPAGDTNSVARWDDKSGNGRHVTQSNASLRPTYQHGILSGENIVRLDGSGQLLNIPAFSVSAGITAFVVQIGRIGSGRNGGLLNVSSYQSASPHFGGASPSDWYENFYSTSRQQLSTASYPSNTPRVAMVQQTGTALAGRVDGAATPGSPKTATFNGSPSVRTIGSDVAAGDAPETQADYFQVVYVQSPSMDTIYRIEGWAAWLGGFQSQLSAGHPYKNAPPYL